MPFSFQSLNIGGAVLITPQAFPDERGFFMETYRASDFCSAGISERFVQENHSFSRKDVLRGLHYQQGPKAQGKLVQVISGEVYDVIVDIERTSTTFGKWLAVVLSAANRSMLYVPPTFAHGFFVLSEEAYVVYRVTCEYAPQHEAGIIWNDPDLGICWPSADVLLSPKDSCWPRLAQAGIELQAAALGIGASGR